MGLCMSTWAVPPLYSAVVLESPRHTRILELLAPSKEDKQSPDQGYRIRAKLTSFSLDDADAQKFIALSYVWGNAPERSTIDINGKPLVITRTLEIALRALRNEKSSVFLWVDQICINQLDGDEKAVQIPLMKDIYTLADETIAWMGEPSSDKDVESCLRYLQRLGGGLVSANFTHLTPKLYTELTAIDEVELLGLVTIDDETRGIKCEIARILAREKQWHELDTLQALDSFFNMPYFQRGWIKQEVALPERLTFRCGNLTIAGNTLYAGIFMHHLHWHHTLRRVRQRLRDTQEEDPGEDERNTLLADRPGFDTANTTMNLRMRYQGKERGLPMTLGDILRKFKSQPMFSSAKDRIYGVLGLATDAEKLNLPATSHREVTVEKLYAAAAKQIILSGDVNFLLYAHRSENSDHKSPPLMQRLIFLMRRLIFCGVRLLLTVESRLPSWPTKRNPFPLRKFLRQGLPEDLSEPSDLPSWAPDLRNMSSQELIVEECLTAQKPFAAGTSRPCSTISEHRMRSSEPANVLTVRGIVVDRIGVVGTQWTNENRDNNGYGALDAYLPLRDFQVLVDASLRILEQKPSHPLWADEKQRTRQMEAVWRVPIADHESISDGLFNKQRATTERSGRGYGELYHSLQLSYRIMVQNWNVNIIKLTDDDERELEGLEGDAMHIRRGELQAEKLKFGPLAANYLGDLNLFETRRAFLSVTGFVGFGPTKIQCGDVICVVFGAQVPVALRPLPGGDRYLFVGEVYCHGVMDGEALEWGREERAFHLC